MTDEQLIRMTNEYIAQAKLKNPQYSLRAFCLKTGIGSGPLSLYLNGKRPLSLDGYNKLITYLVKDPEERKNALSELNKTIVDKLRSGQTAKTFRELTTEEFYELKEWYVFVFLSLIQTKTFDFNVFWISKRLGISLDLTESLIKLCFDYNLIKIEDNRLVRTHENIRTPDNLADKDFEKNINDFHTQLIGQSQRAVVEVPRNLRDITAVTMPTNPEKLEKARELIRKVQDDIMLLVEDGNETEVYRLCIQFYPVSKS